jgi:hypothetical protein
MTINLQDALKRTVGHKRTVDPRKDWAELSESVIAYLRECDNPVPDYGHRRTLRNHLRKLVGAPAEPNRR